MTKKSSQPTKAVDTSDESTAERLLTNGTPSNTSGRYTVVARRYRPKSFDELIGQQTVAAALKSAIESDRVGHAYLFTGARGVGKTSTARIFAKALNFSKSNDADVEADLAAAIDSGEDMDVIEIDGASNRGIEEIRQLRANATVRPSRAAYKIYIIDEVHMLTLPAFNALLKTLEEPPEHVKFIFCTTDPEKIPITVLSRCQRFDFPPIKLDDIKLRLSQICEAEGVSVEDEALRLIARRANGSMRDSQSLLEQLLSFSSDEITVASVHSMLGTADDSRLSELVRKLIARDAGAALHLLDEATQAGVDSGQMAEQLLGYLRDMMAIGIGASEELMKTANPADSEAIRSMANSWGTMTLLASIQMLDDTLVKMRHSVQSRILLEVCLVQMCHLQDLQSIANLAQAIRENAPLPPVIPMRVSPVVVSDSSATVSDMTGKAATVSEKKNDEVNHPVVRQPNEDVTVGHSVPAENADSSRRNSFADFAETADDATTDRVPPLQSNAPKQFEDVLPSSRNPDSLNDQLLESSSISLASHNLTVPDGVEVSNDLTPIQMWKLATVNCEGMISDCAHMAVEIVVEQVTNTWEVVLPAGCDFALQILLDSSNLEIIRSNLTRQFGVQKAIRFKTSENASLSSNAQSQVTRVAKPVSQAQLIRNVSSQPFIAQLIKSLSAEVTKVDVPANYTLKE